MIRCSIKAARNLKGIDPEIPWHLTAFREGLQVLGEKGVSGPAV